VLAGRKQIGRLARWAAAGAVAAALFVAGTNVWVRARARDHAFEEIGAVPARAIAIVPGAPTSRREVKAILEGRLEGALALYRSGQARAILVSGVDTAKDPETSAMRRWLEERGVPARDIVSDAQGTRTRETMFRAMNVFAIDRAIVCTERLHMPRTLFLAERNGIEAVGFALPSPLSSTPRYVVREALKTTLAFVEETFAPKPRVAAPGAAVALR
jgi:SanA protein